MSLKTFISAAKNKTFTKEELASAIGNPTIAELYAAVQECVSSGLLSPVKSSNTNGNRIYPIFLKYRKSVSCEDYAAEEAAISKLHPMLLRTGVLQKNPADFRKYGDRLIRLSDYLFAHPEKQISISRKERSFTVFGEEKALDKENGNLCGMLQKLGIGPAELAFYDTPEYCFADYLPCKKEKMQLLICENKDIWFNIRRMMFEYGCRTLFCVELDGVLYGQGNRVTENGALGAYTSFLRSAEVRYLYWGDLDREGLNIFLRLKEAYPTLSICLFEEAYQAMLTLATNLTLPQSDDHRERIPDAVPLFVQFTAKEKEQAQDILARNLRLPQEIVTFATLKEKMR